MGILNKLNFKKLLLVSSIAVAPFTFAADMSDQAIAERLKPVGSVHIASADGAAGNASAGGARSGEAIFNASCTACHSAGVLGAPKPGNAADWQPRLEKGMETLLKHAINGFNAMPPKGTCGDCSDEEIQAAIDYMTSGL